MKSKKVLFGAVSSAIVFVGWIGFWLWHNQPSSSNPTYLPGVGIANATPGSDKSDVGTSRSNGSGSARAVITELKSRYKTGQTDVQDLFSITQVGDYSVEAYFAKNRVYLAAWPIESEQEVESSVYHIIIGQPKAEVSKWAKERIGYRFTVAQRDGRWKIVGYSAVTWPNENFWEKKRR